MSVNRYNATTDTMEHIAGDPVFNMDEVPTTVGSAVRVSWGSNSYIEISEDL